MQVAEDQHAVNVALLKHAIAGVHNEEQKCSLEHTAQCLGLDLDRAAGSLGLSLQVIIIIKNLCNDRIPALLRALT